MRERSGVPGRSARRTEARSALVEVLLASDLIVAPDAALLARLRDPTDPVAFDELGLDSLALLTLAIDLDTAYGIPLAVEDLVECGDLGRLADLVADHG